MGVQDNEGVNRELKAGFHMITDDRRSETIADARGGGNSHMKQTGMLVVSLSGVNSGFWSRLGCSGQSANILSRQGLV